MAFALVPGVVAYLVLAGALAVEGPGRTGPDALDPTLRAFGVLLAVVFEVLFYWRLAHHFREVAAGGPAPARPGA
jgi:hypothetical protein